MNKKQVDKFNAKSRRDQRLFFLVILIVTVGPYLLQWIQK